MWTLRTQRNILQCGDNCSIFRANSAMIQLSAHYVCLEPAEFCSIFVNTNMMNAFRTNNNKQLKFIDPIRKFFELDLLMHLMFKRTIM